MSVGLISLILLAATLHATWNFFAKRSGGSVVVIWIAAALTTLLTAPFAFAMQWGHAITPTGVALAVASGVIHAAYWWGLAGMYRHGDISLAYPLARGAGVMGTALGSYLFFRDPLSVMGLAGIVCVSLGVLSLGVRVRQSRRHKRAVGLALFTGATIMSYSLVDDRAVEHVHPATLMCIATGVASLILAGLGWRTYRTLVSREYHQHRRAVWIIAVGSPLTYIIVLFAFKMAPVGYVVAAREFSVVIGSLLGVVFLRERLSAPRAIGIALIVLGIGFIRGA